MRRLPKILKRIIKKKRFSLNSLSTARDWRGGMKIDYRITMVKSREEDYYDHLTPLNNQWGTIYVNLKVKGMIQTKERYSEHKSLVEISQATQTTPNYWGGYDTRYDSLWGSQIHKSVRKDIRTKVKSDIRNFLKLLGISTERWDGGVTIKTINWEV